VAVGIGAGVAAVLGLPLSGALLGILLTSSAGPGSAPLVIVGVIVAYLVKLRLEARWPLAAEPAR
jgi:H+/Cl- antiporter ClcA